MKTMKLKQNGQEIEVQIPDNRPDKLYMHTIDGHPAMFDGDQIVYSNQKISLSDMKISLQQIRSEQRKSAKFRKKLMNRIYEEPFFGYSHTLIYLK